MQSLNLCIHSHTPRLAVIDNRSLPVRQVAYWRRDTRLLPEARVTVRRHDAAGRAIAQQDPRLVTDASAPANLATSYSLSGKVLSTTSVDAGWRVSLLGEADQAVQDWDGRGSQRWMEYDEQLRAQAVFEQRADDPRVCTERYRYGGADPACASHNQCGKLIRHDDPAGTQLFAEYGVIGGVLQQTRQLLRDLASPDWPERETDRDALLEPDTEAMTRSSYNGLGEVIARTDAKDNRQLFSQTIAGQLREVRLQVASETAPITLVNAIEYNAHGQTAREVAGNGVITTLDYAPEDGRLSRLLAKRGNTPLQDLRYEYDAAGNVLSIEDAAQPIRYFANQRIEPVSRYGYDSLYQLVEATGWEAGEANRGPRFSPFNDPAPRANYRQTYHYDAGGNLLELIHEGPQSHGHRLVAQVHSNRCLPVHDGVEPGDEDFHRGFDANGNLLSLQPGQALSWDLRNQLREVRPVARDAGPDDVECYVYGADGMRVRKVSLTQTNALTLRAEVRYLPNLELRTHSGTGEVLQVISVQAGRSTIRVLHWEQAPSRATVSDQYRYSLNDHLGSCSLELDSAGEVISQEGYHPFGTTAWFADRGEVEVGYKTLRYSGKERDATGLYYYGFRYYVPWLQRWLNPDPATDIDGLNVYRFVRNNPLTLIDGNGLFPNRPEPTKQDDAFLDAFFSGAELKANIEVRKEIHQSATGWTVLGKTLPNPFKSRENLVSSREELQGANYSIKNGLLYRAHVSGVSPVANAGLLRNTIGSPTPEGFKEYIANVFKHTASTGSKGAVLSLSTQRNVAKGFMSEEKTLTTIDLNKLDVDMAQDFLTVPELILQYGGMMLREGRIEHSDLVKALDQLNNKEHEVFFVGQAIGLNIGEVPAKAIVATKNMGQKTLKIAASS